MLLTTNKHSAGLREAVLHHQLSGVLLRHQAALPGHAAHRQLQHGPGGTHRDVGLVSCPQCLRTAPCREVPLSVMVLIGLQLAYGW